jgi:hypothetical protein
VVRPGGDFINQLWSQFMRIEQGQIDIMKKDCQRFPMI